MEGLGRCMVTLLFLYAYHRSCKVFYLRIRWHLTSLPYIVTSSKQPECYIKCYCTRTNHSYSSIWLPSNQSTRFCYEVTSSLCYGMIRWSISIGVPLYLHSCHGSATRYRSEMEMQVS